MAGKEIEKLVKQIAKLPSLGTRSSRRIVLQLLKKRENLLLPLIESLNEVAAKVQTCEICGNFDTESPCSIWEFRWGPNWIIWMKEPFSWR